MSSQAYRAQKGATDSRCCRNSVSSLAELQEEGHDDDDEEEEEEEVAVKVLKLRDMKNWKQLDLFQREAKVLKGLRHPGIPRYARICLRTAPETCQACHIQGVQGGLIGKEDWTGARLVRHGIRSGSARSKGERALRRNCRRRQCFHVSVKVDISSRGLITVYGRDFAGARSGPSFSFTPVCSD